MYTASLIGLLSCFLHCVVIQIGGGGEVENICYKYVLPR